MTFPAFQNNFAENVFTIRFYVMKLVWTVFKVEKFNFTQCPYHR